MDINLDSGCGRTIVLNMALYFSQAWILPWPCEAAQAIQFSMALAEVWHSETNMNSGVFPDPSQTSLLIETMDSNTDLADIGPWTQILHPKKSMNRCYHATLVLI